MLVGIRAGYLAMAARRVEAFEERLDEEVGQFRSTMTQQIEAISDKVDLEQSAVR